jgi:HD-like signal output (HDOD) protein
MPPLSEAVATKLLASIKLPPRPAAMAAIAEEKRRDAPDFRRISREISNDVALAAAVLKTVNSPLFGRPRKIASIDQAVSMLGLNNIDALVAGLSLRALVPSAGMVNFWEGSMRTAMVSAWLSHRLGGSNKELAHLYGLFHDCAIPILLGRFADYGETLEMATRGESLFIDLENARHGTNHVIVGNLLATNWHLPEIVRQAINLHHAPELFNDDQPKPVRMLIALGRLAEAMEESHSGIFRDAEWPRFEATILDFLNLSTHELADLRDDIHELLTHEV